MQHRLSRVQRIILVLGLLVAASSTVYVPWQASYRVGTTERVIDRARGYALIWQSPPTGWQDRNIVGDRPGVRVVGSVWVDYRRILLSWVGIVTGAGALLFLVGVGAERRARASND